MSKVIAPTPGPDDQYFWDGVAQDKLLLQRCAECHRLRQPPSPMCPGCHSLDWETQESSGRGEIHSWIVSRHPSVPDEDSRIVVLVDLEEGVRLVANLQEIPFDRVRNGMAVEAFFAEVDGVKLPQFRPRTGA
ncbi:MAG: Zn-ribbon domain-containing OB-fold protein [Planctomycetota bacterium]|jgi:uncharacterized OB-fold protein